MDLEINKTIDLLESYIDDPQKRLPEQVFLFLSRLTPMINVDLLIKNQQGQTLLTWREDNYWAPGWHIPGGIIRFKEKISDRIKAVALNELGAKVEFKPKPLATNEIIHPDRMERGHFISMLYECTLISPLDENLKCRNKTPQKGTWAWHDKCPDNLLEVHELYRKFICK
jgi:colanic acid biosynthesis protein WcaH